MARILRGLTSERLDCGCVRGVYETYDGRVVTVFDALGDGCREPGHTSGKVDEQAGGDGAVPPDSHAGA
jgi:hypothetical protein